MISNIAVFCGSSRGSHPEYARQAKKLGWFLAERKINLVFGGSAVGTMKDLADAALSAGGRVTGVMPRMLYEKGIGHPDLTEMIVVETMHERKERMSELCDAVIALPGGFGTLDECIEMVTWAQLGIHQKPIALLNVNDYYVPFVQMMDHMTKEGFLKEVHRDMLIISPSLEEILARMGKFAAPVVGKWVE